MILTEQLSEELKQKYNPEGSVLRKSQMRMLDMLIFIDKVCNENHLTYWIEGGTLLGSFRHNGFIPWDDDADLCMPYHDAEAFKKIMIERKYDTDYVLQCHETDKGYFGSWYVLRDPKTEYLQNSKLHNKREFRGVQVDLFIVEDRVCAPFFSFLRQFQRLIDKPLYIFDSLRFACFLSKPLYCIMHRILIPLFRKISPVRNYYRMPYGSIWNYPLPKKSIYPLSRHCFEGYNLAVPGDAESYLEVLYEDWKQLPDNVQTHKVEILFK